MFELCLAPPLAPFLYATSTDPRLYLRLYNIYPREFHFEVSAQLEMAIVQYTQFLVPSSRIAYSIRRLEISER